MTKQDYIQAALKETEQLKVKVDRIKMLLKRPCLFDDTDAGVVSEACESIMDIADCIQTNMSSIEDLYQDIE